MFVGQLCENSGKRAEMRHTAPKLQSGKRAFWGAVFQPFCNCDFNSIIVSDLVVLNFISLTFPVIEMLILCYVGKSLQIKTKEKEHFNHFLCLQFHIMCTFF